MESRYVMTINKDTYEKICLTCVIVVSDTATAVVIYLVSRDLAMILGELNRLAIAAQVKTLVMQQQTTAGIRIGNI